MVTAPIIYNKAQTAKTIEAVSINQMQALTGSSAVVPYIYGRGILIIGAISYAFTQPIVAFGDGVQVSTEEMKQSQMMLGRLDRYNKRIKLLDSRRVVFQETPSLQIVIDQGLVTQKLSSTVVIDNNKIQN